MSDEQTKFEMGTSGIKIGYTGGRLVLLALVFKFWWSRFDLARLAANFSRNSEPKNWDNILRTFETHALSTVGALLLAALCIFCVSILSAFVRTTVVMVRSNWERQTTATASAAFLAHVDLEAEKRAEELRENTHQKQIQSLMPNLKGMEARVTQMGNEQGAAERGLEQAQRELDQKTTELGRAQTQLQATIAGHEILTTLSKDGRQWVDDLALQVPEMGEIATRVETLVGALLEGGDRTGSEQQVLNSVLAAQTDLKRLSEWFARGASLLDPNAEGSE